MKIPLFILLLTATISCSFSKEEDDEMKTEVVGKTKIDTISQNQSRISTDSNYIPKDGKYLYDVAFAEWNGKSMGVQVTVMINGDSVKSNL